MRFFLKVLAAPFVIVLTILWALMVFLFCWAAAVLNFVSGIAGLIAIVLFISGQTTAGIVIAVIAFLISPVGIPAIARWLIDKIEDLNDTLKCFITA